VRVEPKNSLRVEIGFHWILLRLCIPGLHDNTCKRSATPNLTKLQNKIIRRNVQLKLQQFLVKIRNKNGVLQSVIWRTLYTLWKSFGWVHLGKKI